MYSSLFLIGAISLPAYASGTELIETENPVDGKFIVTKVPGVLTKSDGEIGASQADKIHQIIAEPYGDDISAQSYGEVEQVYGSAMEGFAATLDGIGLLNTGSEITNRVLVAGGSGKKQFTSWLEVQGQVRIYCQDPANYDTTKYGPMQSWDVSQVTSMFQVFYMYYNGQINKCDIPDISGWDVSQVTTFGSMFNGATSFNQNISNWDVSKSTSFGAMFYKGTSFNQNISNWDVSKSTSFGAMFNGATSFNQNISNWDVSKSTYFGWMFNGATSFNQNISNWDVSKSTNFRSMFNHATSFNQNISNWDVSKGTDFYVMLYGASAFKQNLNIWLKWVTKVSHEHWCSGGAVCNAPSLAPTKSPSTTPSMMPSMAPTKSPSITPSMMPSTTPTENKNICDRKSKRVCKKLKDACVFGKSKIFEVCKPKNSAHMHNCTGYDDEELCTDDENHGGLCKFNKNGCSHVCDDLDEKHCKKLRNPKDKKKICKPTKIRNPCKGCKHKTTCG